MLTRKSLFGGVAITALAACGCLAQQDQSRNDFSNDDAEMLKELVLQSRPETNIGLLDQFRSDFKRAGLISWAYEEICRSLEATGELDRALAIGERLVAADPSDVEIAHRGLKVAEKKQDAALINKWLGMATTAADEVLASPQAGESRRKLARSVRAYTDYMQFSDILQIADPAKQRERLEEFLQLRKDSCYRLAVENLYLESWRDSANSRNALAAAKKILETNDSNVIALTMVAEQYQQGENEPKKLMAYGTRILALLDQQPKPEGSTSAEWSKKKALLAARAHWMVGTASIQQERYSEADKSMRAALPYLKGDSRLTSIALFYLGWANYQMGKISDAIRFNKECMLVKGPYREQAARNLETIRAEAASRN